MSQLAAVRSLPVRDALDREDEDIATQVQTYLAAVREDLPAEFGGLVAAEGGAILGALDRLARARARVRS